MRHDGSIVAKTRKVFGNDPRLQDPQEIKLCTHKREQLGNDFHWPTLGGGGSREADREPEQTRLLVSDTTLHTVLVFDAVTLTLICAIGDGAGAGWGGLVGGPPLDTPFGLAAHAQEVFIAEQGAHHISVYTSDRKAAAAALAANGDEDTSTTVGEYTRVRVLGGKGTVAGQFRRPRGLSIVHDEGRPLLIVAEAKRVQVIQLTGEPLQVIEPNERVGTLWGVSTSVDGATVYITDGTSLHVYAAWRRARELAESTMQEELIERKRHAAQARFSTEWTPPACARDDPPDVSDDGVSASISRAEEVEAARTQAEYARQMHQQQIDADRAAARAKASAEREARWEEEAKAAREKEKARREEAKRMAKEASDKAAREIAAAAKEAASEKARRAAAAKAKEEAVEKIMKREAELRQAAAQAQAAQKRERDNIRASKQQAPAAAASSPPTWNAGHTNRRGDKAPRSPSPAPAPAVPPPPPRSPPSKGTPRFPGVNYPQQKRSARSPQPSSYPHAHANFYAGAPGPSPTRFPRSQAHDAWEEALPPRAPRSPPQRPPTPPQQPPMENNSDRSSSSNGASAASAASTTFEETGAAPEAAAYAEEWGGGGVEEEEEGVEMEEEEEEDWEKEGWTWGHWWSKTFGPSKEEVEEQERIEAEELAATRAEEAAARAAAVGRREVMRPVLSDEGEGGGAPVSAAAEPPAAVDAALAESRAAKAAERDAAVTRILNKGNRRLRPALGVSVLLPDAEVQKQVRKLLRLLHPDFGINLDLKGTKKHARIVAAFKKLNGLRESDGK